MPIVPPSQRNLRPFDDPQLRELAARARENAPRRRRIGEVLVMQGVIGREQLDECLAEQRDTPAGQPRRRIGSIIVDRGYATELQVAHALAQALGLEIVDLSATPVSPEMARLVPREMAERVGMVVLAQDGRKVTVAASDPTDLLALDDVRYHTRAGNVRVVIATDSQVHDHLRRAWTMADASAVDSLFDAQVLAESLPAETDANRAAHTAPIVRLVDVIFRDAVAAGASDIHVEPQANALRVRFRVDGVLRDVMTVPRQATAAVASRIKILSSLDIAEHRRPQDGRARLLLDGTPIDARVSTLPALHGEKVVVRLLPRGDDLPRLDTTGIGEEQLELLRAALQAPQGLILITGPTGSGKTNTLYAALRDVCDPSRNVVTLEDPVEVQFPGITQVQIHDKAGLTFAAGLRSVLRQDPDVVLVGEVRDAETATLALQASMTGHLVLTTLHTNDSVRAITRLVDMGVEPFLVASSLSLVVAQRLVRRPCPACAVPAEPPDDVLARLGLTPADLATATPRHGRGCQQCGGSGYRGRLGIFEVLPVTARLRRAMLEGAGEAEVAAVAQQNGLVTLRMTGIAAARRGETTYDEVLRGTHVDAADLDEGQRCYACARQVGAAMEYCPWCRVRLARHRCRECGARLDRHWAGCPGCGTAVEPSGGVEPPGGETTGDRYGDGGSGSDDSGSPPPAVAPPGRPDR